MPETFLQRILYVENDKAAASLLRKKLERKPLTISVAATAKEALALLDKEAYDLLLVAQELPDLNGVELLELLRRRPAMPPFILLVPAGGERIAVTALEKGAAGYAVKDQGRAYLDLLPAVMQAAYAKERLQRENERQHRDLKAANQAKTTFLTTINHEIRTPLNVLTGVTRFLAQTGLDAKQCEMVEMLRGNADLLLGLVNDLLDISRIEAGQVELEPGPFTLSAVLANVEAMFAPQARQKNISLLTEDRTGGKLFYGDLDRLQQIVTNLAGNAVKFTHRGEVRIKTRISGVALENNWARVVIEVQDTGIGIEPEKLESIFDTFSQGDDTITRRFGGSGIGLSIARSLATMMGGTITVKSKPDAGSCFTFTVELPLAAGKTVPGETTEMNSASHKGTVLVVEDYAPNVMVASMILEDIGFEAVIAENGIKAIEKVSCAKHPFTAILMDVQMQDMDGFEATQRIRQLEAGYGFRHTIIGVTAHALAGDRERCISAGMDDYISKPIHPDILATKLGLLAMGPHTP